MKLTRTRGFLREEWTSDNFFDGEPMPPDAPGIYLIVLVVVRPPSRRRTYRVMYVGMSTRLKRRLLRHEVMEKVRDEVALHRCLTGSDLTVVCPTFFFRPCAENLRGQERDLIRQFNPPLNLIGKIPHP